MSFQFDRWRGLIVVRAELFGPTGSGVLELALDTGATRTLLNVAMVMAVGYDPLGTQRVQVTTGSGVEFASSIEVHKLAALGQERNSLPILCHTLPPSAGVDGLLGLDFFRGHRLSIDFRIGHIYLD